MACRMAGIPLGLFSHFPHPSGPIFFYLCRDEHLARKKKKKETQTAIPKPFTSQ